MLKQIKDFEEGDVIICNDPYLGGQHLLDVQFFSPVFVDGELVAFVADIAHQLDMGGAVPGGVAGGLPAIAGRTAVIGYNPPYIDMVAVLMGLFVLCWIPLHILTLALIPENLEGYKNASVPMWPVVSSETQTIRVITLSAILCASIIVLAGISLQINILVLLPLILFCGFILFQAFANIRQPSHRRTFKIFKLASFFMAFAFLWLFVGVVLTSFLPF